MTFGWWEEYNYRSKPMLINGVCIDLIRTKQFKHRKHKHKKMYNFLTHVDAGPCLPRCSILSSFSKSLWTSENRGEQLLEIWQRVVFRHVNNKSTFYPSNAVFYNDILIESFLHWLLPWLEALIFLLISVFMYEGTQYSVKFSCFSRSTESLSD